MLRWEIGKIVFNSGLCIDKHGASMGNCPVFPYVKDSTGMEPENGSLHSMFPHIYSIDWEVEALWATVGSSVGLCGSYLGWNSEKRHQSIGAV